MDEGVLLSVAVAEGEGEADGAAERVGWTVGALEGEPKGVPVRLPVGAPLPLVLPQKEALGEGAAEREGEGVPAGEPVDCALLRALAEGEGHGVAPAVAVSVNDAAAEPLLRGLKEALSDASVKVEAGETVRVPVAAALANGDAVGDMAPLPDGGRAVPVAAGEGEGAPLGLCVRVGIAQRNHFASHARPPAHAASPVICVHCGPSAGRGQKGPTAVSPQPAGTSTAEVFAAYVNTACAPQRAVVAPWQASTCGTHASPSPHSVAERGGGGAAGLAPARARSHAPQPGVAAMPSSAAVPR